VEGQSVTDVAEVRLWGTTIGAVAFDNRTGFASFGYDPQFARTGVEVSPLRMPLRAQSYVFPELAFQSFHGLPGMLADSLPDRFGNKLIDTWLQSQQREAGSLNPIERLCYTGARGMGALEFSPAIGPRVTTAHQIKIDALVELASEILTSRNDLEVSFATSTRKRALSDILRVGTSAGGARAKAVIAWNRETEEVRSGQIEAGDGFEYWLIKFDGVQGNKDKELEDPQGYGLIEFAYYKMALDCGITMNECRLLEEGNRHHFMTRRFDRTRTGGKLHMQSLGALAHYDYNEPGAYGYEDALYAMRQLDLGMPEIEEQFRRMVFNIVGRNQDDHVKNIAFLMDQSGNWSLSPAFDLTYSYNPSGDFTSNHQMTLNGKRNNFTFDDFKACAKSASMKRGRAETIIGEVHSVISRWRDYADEAGVHADRRDKIQNALSLEPLRQERPQPGVR
jgi:serine/threonine-protein kinase HipA